MNCVIVWSWTFINFKRRGVSIHTFGMFYRICADLDGECLGSMYHSDRRIHKKLIAFQCWKIWRFLFGLTRWLDVCVPCQRNPSQYFGDTGLSVFVSPVSAVRVAYRVLESSSGLVAAPGSGRWSKMDRCDSKIRDFFQPSKNLGT